MTLRAYPVELLNYLELSGVPSHKLELKVGVPVLLMRNLDAPRLCNATRTTPELAPPLLITTPRQREDVKALDRFNVHRSLSRRVCNGTELKLMTCQPRSDTLTTTIRLTEGQAKPMPRRGLPPFQYYNPQLLLCIIRAECEVREMLGRLQL
ncbi:hypothetical protein TNCV_1774981 [Trichonephila clavipes]|nr:hypothetical protein TNCV_1774981 [Trichonephila clavipes]